MPAIRICGKYYIHDSELFVEMCRQPGGIHDILVVVTEGKHWQFYS
jgi:hypothetical protein